MKQELRELVERFNRNIEDYKSSGYDEENTKIDFIDRFFALLGWDINNKEGHSEEYREVVREDKVIIKGRPKSPDYSFRFGKEKLFFVEAKRPSVNIKDDTKPAYQVRRYAYSAGLTVSVLTDFEEFAIYDATVKPKENDKASIARVFYCKYNEYEKNWEFLQNTLSKKAVVTGKFKDFVVKGKGKKGTQSVDKEILKMIEAWRDILARNIALRNKHIDIYQLNEAVQKTIDRIIFLRMAEDRNTERYGTLTDLAKKNKIYDKLVLYFNSSNKKYNSGLFKVQKWLDKLAIDDKIFTHIISDLYYPVPYEFSVLPIEILGHIYEQFLGKIIRLTKGRQAKIEEKPEVRKAGGVYYTPKYIVDYIVANTVGKKIGVLGIGDRILEENVNQDQTVVDTDHTLKDMDRTQPEINHILQGVVQENQNFQGVVKEKKDVNITKTRYPKPKTLKILDPACGSGSFLVGAYKFLLEFHLKYWTDKKNIKKGLKEEHIYQAGENNYRLTTKIKRSILLNNIYGVDIDAQAVEVTKLSLLMTMMEGEIAEAGSELFFKDRKEALLPDLENNIKCGNSLIGTDFYADKDLQLFDTDEQRKINCFDWEEEFKEIMDAGGFDCVIGNPPYRLLQPNDTNTHELNYYRSKYNLCKFKIDFYQLFLERVITKIIKFNGKNGFIIPLTLLNNVYVDLLRKHILLYSRIDSISINDEKVFDADVHTMVLIYSKSKKNIKNNDSIINTTLNLSDESFKCKTIKYSKIKQNKYLEASDYIWNMLLNEYNYSIIKRITKHSIKLKDLCEINRGLITGDKKKYFSNKKINDNYLNIVAGKDVKKYFLNDSNEFVLFIRPKTSGGCWDSKVHKSKHKVLIRQIGLRPTATFIAKPIAVTGNIFTIRDKSKDIRNEQFILGIINSTLISYFWRIMFSDFKSSFPQVTIKSLSIIPIPKLNLSNKAEKKQHDRMVNLVEQMLEAQKEAHNTEGKSESQIKFAKQRIELLDRQIDALAYELYGLTEEEIGIVEGV